MNSFLITDCGSTTTKAILILRNEDGYYMAARGEAPTTVEAPFDDVTIGVLNAAYDLEESFGRKLVKDGKIYVTDREDEGVNAYLSTSSAGGGLQITACGVVGSMSAESAERCALGAGAIVIDTISVDDGRKYYERIDKLRKTRPDMILLAGGTDGGTVRHLARLAETVLASDPKPRLGNMKLPVIYCGNREAAEDVRKILGDKVELKITDNIRPSLERENLHPAREAIHELFLQHVMKQSPGYDRLTEWTTSEIMSTPNAFGNIIIKYAKKKNLNIMAVDIGGATTDVFSVIEGKYTRTVSANLGMSYSVGNVLCEAGTENIERWLDFPVEEKELRDIIRNKMIRPTIIPMTVKSLKIEQAVAREALRLSFEHHKSLARSLKGVQNEGDMTSIVRNEKEDTLMDTQKLDMIIGSGGVLSHAPERRQAALMMMDAYNLKGITLLCVDSVFMMPHLGVLTETCPEASEEVFEKDCLVRLGTVFSFRNYGRKIPDCSMSVFIDEKEYNFRYGTLNILELLKGKYNAVLKPNCRFDFGGGRGKNYSCVLESGELGIIFDLRKKYN
ncbi:MAG: glutamate mutase L [Armatimonadetes bacterium]|nr:glutamate mutase L [Candidatus Hippobium faecium]